MGVLTKIVSGGQTGADRAALDTAIKFNVPHGGWITKGRKTESGPLPDFYNLQEMNTRDYPAGPGRIYLIPTARLLLPGGL